MLKSSIEVSATS